MLISRTKQVGLFAFIMLVHDKIYFRYLSIDLEIEFELLSIITISIYEKK
jgi:hypothetical protein